MGPVVCRDVKKRSIGAILPWMLCFLLAVVLILGYVRCYELSLENQERQEQLELLTEKRAELEKEYRQLTSEGYLEQPNAWHVSAQGGGYQNPPHPRPNGGGDAVNI